MLTKRTTTARARFPLAGQLEKTVLAAGEGQLLLLCISLAVGLIGGRCLVGRLGAEMEQSALELVGGFLNGRVGNTPLQVFLTSFLSAALPLLAVFFLGFCAIGVPVLYLIPLIRGLGLGLGYGTLFHIYGWQAMATAAVHLPSAVLSTLVLVYACREAVRLSFRFWSCAGRGEGPPRHVSPAIFYTRIAIFAVAMGGTALVDTVLFWIFGI